MNGMIFRSFQKRNSSQKNTNTVYWGKLATELFPQSYDIELELSFKPNPNPNLNPKP